MLTARALEIPAEGGEINATLYTPPRGEARPCVLLLMDAPAVRPALHDMARHVASRGYRCLLPNLYWRQVREVNIDRAAFAQEGSAERARIFGLAGSLTNAQFLADLPLMLAAVGASAAAPAALLGYCMSGRFALQGMARFPDLVACAASFYGTRMVSEAADSPHLVIGGLRRGEAYLAFAETDGFVPPAQVETLRGVMAGTGIRHQVEVYPGTHHAFAQPDSAHFDAAAAERHWQALFALLARMPGGTTP